jgi:hypothetical protein
VKFTDPDGRFNIIPYPIKDMLSQSNSRLFLQGVPLGCGYTSAQKDLYKLINIFNAAIGASNISDYATLAATPTQSFTAAITDVAKTIVGSAIKRAGYAMTALDVGIAVFSDTSYSASNYTKDEISLVGMIAIEQAFTLDLLDALNASGLAASANYYDGTNMIANIKILANSFEPDAVNKIAEMVKSGNPVYKDVLIK